MKRIKALNTSALLFCAFATGWHAHSRDLFGVGLFALIATVNALCAVLL